MVDWVAFSVDLEPNKDDTLDGIPEAMDWFDDVVPRGTAYTTHRIATELPEVVERLATDHEIGVHVHPREFGHEHDQFAELDIDRQRELLVETREALAEATPSSAEDITAFRAGRHGADEMTFVILDDLGFRVDASINVRYQNYLPADLTHRQEPFVLDAGLVELPTTYVTPPLLSPAGLRVFPQRTLTATANTLRTDSRGCSGLRAMRTVLNRTGNISMYMHPYDATDHHSDLTNGGGVFRDRVESLFTVIDERTSFVSAADIAGSVDF